MKNRLPLFALLLAAIAGSACLKTPTSSDLNDGLPPDTLPLSIADSVITFSINTSAIHVADSLQVFFTIRNNGSTTRTVQGSSSCTFTVNVYNLSGTKVSPAASRACTEDLATFATLTPGEVVTVSRIWYAGNYASSGQTAIPAGVYELEPFLDASGFQRTGRRLKIQIVNR